MSVTYAPTPGGPRVLMLGVVLVWGIALSAVAAGQAPFAVVMAVAAAVITWLLVVRLAHEVVIEGDEIRWRTLAGAGSAPVAELVRVRPARFERSMLVVELGSGRGPVLMARPGLAAVVEALTAARPGLELDLGPWSDGLDRLERRRGPRR